MNKIILFEIYFYLEEDEGGQGKLYRGDEKEAQCIPFGETEENRRKR